MQMFQGFKPEGMKKIQQRMGYTGPADQFQSYLQANPDKQMMMNSYVNKAMNMASGGYVRNFNTGGFNLPEGFNSMSYLENNPDVSQGITRGEFTSAEDHFRRFGGGENRAGSVGLPAGFDSYKYIEANPDLAQAYEAEKGIPITTRQPTADIDKFGRDHFTRFGFQEGRPLNLGADPRDAIPITRTEPTQPPPEGDTVTQPPPEGTVTQPPPEGDTTDPQPIQPDPDRTFATFQDLQTAPRESLTPEQVHILNFYSNTPEQQEAINAMPQFSNAQLPVGQYQPGVRTTAPPPAGTDGQTVSQGPIPSWLTPPPEGSVNTQALVTHTNPLTGETYTTSTGGYSVNVGGETDQSTDDTVTGATGVGSVNGAVVLSNRPDVAQAIEDGNTFGVDPATLEGLTDEQKNQKIVEAWFNTFGNKEGVNPNTGLSNTPSNFDNVSDQVIIDYLDQYPDLREAFGGPPYSQATLAQARSHYADFGRKEIADGGRAGLVVFDLSPEQLEAFRYSKDEYQNLTPEELRRTYIAIGGASGATNFDRNAQILNSAEMQIYRDNNSDLANLSDYELRQHFIQFGRQEMLQNKRPKIDALVPPQSPYAGLTSIGDISSARMERPVLVGDTKLTAQSIAGPGGTVPTGTDITSTTAGQVSGDRTATYKSAGQATGATAGTQDQTATTTVQDTTKTEDDVKTVTDATKGRTLDFTLDAEGKERAIPKAAQATATDTLFQEANLSGETGTATDAKAAERADITDPEKLRETVVRDEAKTFVEGVVAASADPSGNATVAGQLANLLADFTLSDPPAWAAGAVRFATAEMARRGLGTSSMAGQAIVQAAMEAALPIAQADAQIQAQFEGQNLSNKQQMAMFYAQQRANFIGKEFDQEFQANVANTARISEIADLNFNAQQQVVLENSRATNTMNLNNLSNKQAILMAEAATLSQLDMSNLNNRQQAAVQSAQAFLQKDMTDVSNEQQTTLFNAQQRIQSLFADGAADNARKQFNASSESQTEQFFANLSTQVSQFNEAQKNAMSQFNSGQENTINRFNEELSNQRDQFNAQNRLVIDQSNAQWRRQINTTDTAATNRANEINATALLDISNTAYNDLWQYYADAMEFAWTSAENERTRAVNLGIAQLQADNNTDIAELKNDFQSSLGFGSLIGSFLTADSSSFAGSVLNKFLG